MNTILKSARRFACATFLGLVLAGGFGQAAKAVDLSLWVLANGTQWALVVPGSNTGGRVVYSPQHCTYITDRVSRGEVAEIWAWAQPAEYYTQFSFKLISTLGTHLDRRPCFLQGNGIYSVQRFHVPESPLADNCRVRVVTCADDDRYSLPVGRR